ncbi:histidine--tRNA ligase [Candidatus Dependentiae bacterium]|nr:histidine--tRNA ligase [Candidatus Dependentiae bacterium]
MSIKQAKKGNVVSDKKINAAVVTRVRGTEDILDMASINLICTFISRHLATHGFAEIRTPVLEKTELFVRAVGADTDVVSKEMYTFEKGSEGSVCLRPELTAPIVRAFYEHDVSLSPWKVFQFGPAFRYERPQKGRLRQFFTYSIEVINALSVKNDVSTIVMFDRLFKKLGICDFVLQLNFLGVVEDRMHHKEALRAFLVQNDAELCETCRERREKNVLRVFDCKNEQCQRLYTKAPQLEHYLSEKSRQEWLSIQSDLQLLSVNFILNPLLVRGLDYYNGVVFEFTSDALGSQSTFCGGGRYDLSSTFGKKDLLPSIGAGIGLERIFMIMQAQQNDLLSSLKKELSVVIVPMDVAQEGLALQIVENLTAQDICAQVIFDGAGIKQKMKRADKIGADFVVIIGERELLSGIVSVKNMKSGESTEVAIAQLATHVRHRQL